MPSVAIITALVAGFLGIVFVAAGVAALARRRLFRTMVSVTFGLLLLAVGLLLGTVSLATQGYRALTREEVAAVVRTEPAGPRRFTARFHFPDGRESTYELAGDELYVDAHILKWKPIANVFGLHTSYELDRVAGRYSALAEEQSAARTVFSLAEGKPVDMFQLRRRYAWLRPLLDTEYGSATFITADKPEEFEVRVSTTGLLVRRRGPE